MVSMMSQSINGVRSIVWAAGELRLLDQRKLPAEEVYISLLSPTDVASAITDMVVRGAPAIGITAAYGVVLSAMAAVKSSDWNERIESDIAVLAQSRPTAINLHWALERMRSLLDGCADDLVARLTHEAVLIHEEDIEANLEMGRLGSKLIKDSGVQAGVVMTHCNAGALATGGYGTALGVIRRGYEDGVIASVYADETRPWLQGSRLTAWELMREGIPVTLNADGAAAHLMKAGGISWVVVGSDRITANGDVANKIGTYSLAILAKHHGVKFMVVAPTSTIDMSLVSGDDIPIEERAGTELSQMFGAKTTPDGVDVVNPVFDVTPAALVDAIVTEKGVVLAPNEKKMAALFV